MRIAVLGAGAIGSAIGALLQRAGFAVTLIGRPNHVAAIQQHGLQLVWPNDHWTVPIASAEYLTFVPDLALLATKTQDVAATVHANRELLRGAPLVTLQNGVRSDELVASVLSDASIISAVVVVQATYLEAGHVSLASRNDLVIGRPDGSLDAQLGAIAAVLNLALPTGVSTNIVGAHWTKLIFNLNNALPALVNCSLAQVYADAAGRRLAVLLMREGLRVIDAAGIRLESLPRIAVPLLRALERLPLGLAARLAARRVRQAEAGMPLLGSMLQSLRRGRPTEIDYLNGEIVRLAERIGTSAPLNRALVECVQQVEQSGQFVRLTDLQREVDARARTIC